MHTENKFPKVCRSYHPHADGGLHVVLTTLVGQESKDQLANQAFVARTILRKIVQEPFLHHPQADADVKACQGVGCQELSIFVYPTYEVLRKRMFGSWTPWTSLFLGLLVQV